MDYSAIIQDINNSIQGDKNKKDTEAQTSHTLSTENHALINSQTGIKELDAILQGGFPQGAVVLLTGSSGSGKTILSFEWLFEGVRQQEHGLYITLTEPLFKIVENLEKMDYYDRTAIENEAIKLVDIRDKVTSTKFNEKELIDFIEEAVKQTQAKRLCIDSITAIAYNLEDYNRIRQFIFDLGTILATLGCTTVLTSEVHDSNKYSIFGVEEFISDAIIRLDQMHIHHKNQRIMRIVKVRGKSYDSDDMPLDISKKGIALYPKIRSKLDYLSTEQKISMGNISLNEMLKGGIVKYSTTLIGGTTGVGKTILSLQFIMEGLQQGEHCLYVSYEESKHQLFRNARIFGWDLEHYEKEGNLTIKCYHPSDKIVEEHLRVIQTVVEGASISRCVIDSLSAIAHAFPENMFYNYVFQLNGLLKNKNITSLFTSATTGIVGAKEISESNISSIFDNIIMMRFVEMEGKLESVINIIKMRASSHQKDLRKYTITENGITIGESLRNYEGVMTGVSKRIHELEEEGNRLKNLLQEKEEMEKKLHESEERYRTIFENSAIGITMVDKDENLISWNKYSEELLGLNKEQHLQRSIQLLYPKEEWDRLRSENIRQKGMKHHLETKMYGKSGDIIDVAVSLSVLKDGKGDIIGSIGAIKDISEKKKAERKLNSLIDCAPDSIYLLDKDHRYILVNNELVNRLGKTRDEVLGKRFEDFHSEEENHDFIQKLNSVFETGVSVNDEHQGHNLARWFLRTITPIFDDHTNKVSSVAIISKDISDRKIMEQELKQSEEKYRTIFDNSAIGIMLTNEHEQIISWNKFTENLLEMNKDDLELKHVRSLYPAEEWQKIREENIREKGVKCHYKTKMYKKDGSLIEVNLSLSILKDDVGNIIGSIGIIEDITDQIGLEQKLNEACTLLKMAEEQIRNK